MAAFFSTNNNACSAMQQGQNGMNEWLFFIGGLSFGIIKLVNCPGNVPASH